jgi:hypothetical protein
MKRIRVNPSEHNKRKTPFIYLTKEQRQRDRERRKRRRLGIKPDELVPASAEFIHFIHRLGQRHRSE